MRKSELTLAIVVLLDDLRTVDLSKTVVRRTSRRTGVGHRSAAPRTTASVFERERSVGY